MADLFDKLCGGQKQRYGEADNAAEVQIYPWIDWEEWKKVYQCLYSEDRDEQMEGVQLARMMKLKSAPLPIGVDATANWVEALLIEDKRYKISHLTVVLIRFIKEVTNLFQQQYYQRTLKSIAEEINLSTDLVGMRNKCVHGTQPSVYELEASAKQSLKWLKAEYWEKQFNALTDDTSDVVVFKDSVKEKEKKKENLIIQAALKELFFVKKIKSATASITASIERNLEEFVEQTVAGGSVLFHKAIIGEDLDELPSVHLIKRKERALCFFNLLGEQGTVKLLTKLIPKDHKVGAQWMAFAITHFQFGDKSCLKELLSSILQNAGVKTRELLDLIVQKLEPPPDKHKLNKMYKAIDQVVDPSHCSEDFKMMDEIDQEIEDSVNGQKRKFEDSPGQNDIPQLSKMPKVPPKEDWEDWMSVDDDEEWKTTPLGLMPGQTISQLMSDLEDLFQNSSETLIST